MEGALFKSSSNSVVDDLNDLIQLDIDAWHAYCQAIDAIKEDKKLDPNKNTEICDALTKFRKDHERHVDILSVLVKEQGGTPPSFSRDFKGFLISGYTAVRSAMGVLGALKAMQTNEQLTNKNYDAATKKIEKPLLIREAIMKNFEDEKRHLQAINQFLKELEE